MTSARLFLLLSLQLLTVQAAAAGIRYGVRKRMQPPVQITVNGYEGDRKLRTGNTAKQGCDSVKRRDSNSVRYLHAHSQLHNDPYELGDPKASQAPEVGVSNDDPPQDVLVSGEVSPSNAPADADDVPEDESISNEPRDRIGSPTDGGIGGLPPPDSELFPKDATSVPADEPHEEISNEGFIEIISNDTPVEVVPSDSP